MITYNTFVLAASMQLFIRPLDARLEGNYALFKIKKISINWQ